MKKTPNILMIKMVFISLGGSKGLGIGEFQNTVSTDFTPSQNIYFNLSIPWYTILWYLVQQG